MERLTDKAQLKYSAENCLSTEYVSRPIFTKNGDEVVFGHAIDRLAAYEDTGLTPDAAAQLKKIAEIFNCDPNDPAQLKQLCDKLRDWQQAERAGRLVVLPIKTGDTAFFVINNRIFGGEVYLVNWEHHKSFGVRMEVSADCIGGTVCASLFDFGKTVFLTRKEAEEAVERKEDAT